MMNNPGTGERSVHWPSRNFVENKRQPATTGEPLTEPSTKVRRPVMRGANNMVNEVAPRVRGWRNQAIVMVALVASLCAGWAQATLTEVYRFYHVPASNTAVGHLILENQV